MCYGALHSGRIVGSKEFFYGVFISAPLARKKKEEKNNLAPLCEN
jgi:hypothetical protein